MNAKEARQVKAVFKAKLSNAMMRHVGRNRAIGMGELYELVFGRKYEHRINDTRELRKLITDLRWDGHSICTCPEGYFLASASSELNTYVEWLRRRALKILAMIARILKVSAEELAGQLVLPLKEEMLRQEYAKAAADEGMMPSPQLPGGGERGKGQTRRSPGGRT